MTSIEDKFIINIIKKENQQRQRRKKINDVISTLKNSGSNEDLQWLKNRAEKKIRKKNSKMSQINKLIASLSSDTVVKLIEMLQRDIRHSIRQIELLTGQKMSIGSQKWSAERVCSAKLSEIRKEEDLWAVYVRGFAEGYCFAGAKSNFNSRQSEQLVAKSNTSLTENSSPQIFGQSPSLKVTRQKDQLEAEAILTGSSIERHDVPRTYNEVAANPCFNPIVVLEPMEFLESEPDLHSYLDTQVASEMLLENGALFGTHMLCGGGGLEDFTCEISDVADKMTRSPTNRLPLCDGHCARQRKRLPFACVDCSMTYAHRGSLSRHRKKHHRRLDDEKP